MAQTVRREACSYCGSKDNICYYYNEFGKLVNYCQTPDCSYNKEKRDDTKMESRDLIEGGYCDNIYDRGISKETCEKYNYKLAEFNNKKVHIENYYAHNEVAAQKLRIVDNKQFLWTGNQYNCGFFGEQLFAGQPVCIITEGAIDCLSVAQTLNNYNEYLVLSLKNGAGKGKTKKELQSRIDFLYDFKKIVLLFDSDKVGKLAFDECMYLFEPGKLWCANLQLKDANEYLKNNKREELKHELDNIKRFVPPAIKKPSLDELLSEKVVGLPIFLPKTSESIRGLQTKKIYTILGGPGSGKSSLTKHLIMRLLKENRDLYAGAVYLEEPLNTTAKSIIAIEEKVPLYQLEENPQAIEKDKYEKAYNEYIESGRIKFIDACYMSIDGEQLFYHIEYLAKVYNCKVIVLDHLTMITYDDKSDNERKEVDRLMKRLRALVNDLDIAIILVVHLRRSSNGKGWDYGEEISQADARASGAIEQLSDVMLGVERNQHDPYQRYITNIRILKNRIGGITGPMDKYGLLEKTWELRVLN